MDKTVYFTALPFATQDGHITVPDDVEVDDDYIREHWDDVELDEPTLDYCGTDIVISE